MTPLFLAPNAGYEPSKRTETYRSIAMPCSCWSDRVFTTSGGDVFADGYDSPAVAR
jgi:hypothetical protein